MRQSFMALIGIVIIITAAPVFAADCGDVNNSGNVNALDITYLINYLYKHGSMPFCGMGDANNSGTVNASLDISYIINYLYTTQDRTKLRT